MIVLDCNAAINIVSETSDGRGLEALLLKGESVISPAFFCAEITRVLEKRVRRGCSNDREAQEMGRVCLSLVDEFVPDTDLWEEALSESLRLRHSSYDLLYLVLARRNAATLFTLDERLRKLCLDNGVNCVALDDEL